MSNIALSFTDEPWHDDFGLSKLDSWITPKKRARCFFRTSPSDESSSAHKSAGEDTDDDQIQLGIPGQDNRIAIRPSIITIPTRDDNHHLLIHLNDKSIRRIDGAKENVIREKRQRCTTETTVADSSSFPTASLISELEVLETGPPRRYKTTCYAITMAETRCSLLPLKGKPYCHIHSKRRFLHGTLDDKSIYKTRDTRYKGKPGTTRCRASTRNNIQCTMSSVAKWDMCRRHLRTPPTFFVPFAPTSPISHSSDSDDDSGRQQRYDKGHPKKKHELSKSTPSQGFIHDASDECSLSSSSSFDSLSSGEISTSLSESDSSPMSSSLGSCSLSCSSSQSDSMVSPHRPSQHRPWIEPTEYDHSRDVIFTGEGNEIRCSYISGSGQECPYRTKDKVDAVYCRGHDVLTPRLEHLLRAKDDYMAPETSCDHDLSSSETSDNGTYHNVAHNTNDPRPYTYREFMKLWKNCEEYIGESTDDIENTKHVRSANKSLSLEDTDGQVKAQYGRLLPRAMMTMMKDILCLHQDDVFLDIGHGIGNTCLQAAFTVGCEARGIEVVFSRNSIAEVFRDNMFIQHRTKVGSRIVGEVKLRHGRLEDDIHREFLTKGITRAYVNNFNGVFAERSVKNNSVWFLDDYCAALFALMAPGAILVTLHPLNLGPTQEEANRIRRKHDLSESSNSSFFTVEQVVLGKASHTVKWNQHSGNSNDIHVYKYTRLDQEAGPDSVFMCCNPGCQLAKKGVPIRATTTNEEGRCVINQCECKFTAKNLRRQRKKKYP